MLDRYRAPFRDFGLLAGLAYAADRTVSRMSPAWRVYAYDFMAQPIPGEFSAEKASRSIEMRELRRGDPEISLMPARPDIKEARFAQNAVCLGAFRRNAMIGYIWFRFGAYEEDEVRCTYVPSPAGEAVVDFDLYIFPEHRMSRAFVHIWNHASAYLQGRGIRWSYSRVTRYNVASRRAHERLAARRVGSAIFIKMGRVETMIATVFPYLHFSIRAGDRVRLVLREATDTAAAGGSKATADASTHPVAGVPHAQTIGVDRR